MENKPILSEDLDYRKAITDYLRQMGLIIKETLEKQWCPLDFFNQVLIIMLVSLLQFFWLNSYEKKRNIFFMLVNDEVLFNFIRI